MFTRSHERATLGWQPLILLRASFPAGSPWPGTARGAEHAGVRRVWGPRLEEQVAGLSPHRTRSGRATVGLRQLPTAAGGSSKPRSAQTTAYESTSLRPRPCHFPLVAKSPGGTRRASSRPSGNPWLPSPRSGHTRERDLNLGLCCVTLTLDLLMNTKTTKMARWRDKASSLAPLRGRLCPPGPPG